MTMVLSQRGMWDSTLTSCNWCFLPLVAEHSCTANLQRSQKWNLQLRHFILVLFVSLDEQTFILPTSLKNDYRLLNQHKYFCILYIIHCIMAPCNKCANKSNIDLMHAYVNTFFANLYSQCLQDRPSVKFQHSYHPSKRLTISHRSDFQKQINILRPVFFANCKKIK